MKEKEKGWLRRLLALPLGRCLPEIALCMLLCCLLTGYVVMTLMQREQHRQDTFAVYMQEHGQSVQAASAAPPQADSDGDSAETAADTSVQLYATPGGQRYHYDSACPGENAQAITWDEATRRGLTPCKKCAQ